jgi:hypothetical protein
MNRVTYVFAQCGIFRMLVNLSGVNIMLWSDGRGYLPEITIWLFVLEPNPSYKKLFWFACHVFRLCIKLDLLRRYVDTWWYHSVRLGVSNCFLWITNVIRCYNTTLLQKVSTCVSTCVSMCESKKNKKLGSECADGKKRYVFGPSLKTGNSRYPFCIVSEKHLGLGS